jgi:choline transport protein
MINVFAWLAISASVCVIIPNIVLGLAAYWNPTFVAQKYQSFLLYQASNLLILGYNIAVLRRASWTHNVGMVFSLLCFLTFFIACLAKVEFRQRRERLEQWRRVHDGPDQPELHVRWH